LNLFMCPVILENVFLMKKINKAKLNKHLAKRKYFSAYKSFRQKGKHKFQFFFLLSLLPTQKALLHTLPSAIFF
jgi:hypothetical protein